MSRGWLKVGGLVVVAATVLLLATSSSEARPRGSWGGYGRGYYYGYPGYYGYGYSPYGGYYGGYYGFYGPSYSGYYGDGFYGDFGSRPRFYRYGYRTFAPAYFDSGPIYYESAPRSISTGGYYGALEQSTTAGDANAAHLSVMVPADAEIWVEGQKMAQMGESRSFVSPALTPGKEFTYDIRARWMENGKEKSLTKHVKVHAGEQVKVDFMKPSATEEGQGKIREGRPAERLNAPEGNRPEGRKAPSDRRNLPGTPAPEEATPLDKNAPKEANPLDKNAPKEANPLDKNAPKEANPLDKNAPKEANPLDKNAPKEANPLDKKEANPLDKKETNPSDNKDKDKPKDQNESKP